MIYPILTIGIIPISGFVRPACWINSAYKLIIENENGIAIIDDIKRNITDIIILARRSRFRMIFSVRSSEIITRMSARFAPDSFECIIISNVWCKFSDLFRFAIFSRDSLNGFPNRISVNALFISLLRYPFVFCDISFSADSSPSPTLRRLESWFRYCGSSDSILSLIFSFL